MKTIHEYEPQDIVWNDPVHAFLIGQILIVGITGFAPRKGDPEPTDPTWVVKRMVAQFLNAAQKEGLVISKAELPAAFTAVPHDT